MTGKLPDAQAFAALNAVLDAALALPRAEQAEYLARVCGDDAQRLKELHALLDNAHATGTWERDLRHDPAWHAALTTISAADIPTQVGDWRVTEEVGRGGMACVYRAERALQGFVQTAALKVMAPGALSADTLARFEQERRILARLSDARIARLYDGGVLADGRPWLAMEFVAGQRLDRWCDAHRLDVRARVHLVLELIGAVASAHRSLIVHRDIKPANALVTDTGQVKLLDFGIAKIVEDDGDGAATGTGLRALTPHYASPEQLAGAPVTTATDVYQLGLLLYELLTGRRPHQNEEATLPRLARAVMEQEVPSCAQALRAHGDGLSAVAQARATTPDKLRQQIGGDLQRVLLKALSRDPAARYDSAALFGEDLRRALSGQPVTAVPPSRAYRLRRFVARHRLSVAAGIALALSVIVGAVATAWQAREALHQRDQARVEADKAARLSQFLVSVFANADPMQTQGEQVTAKTLLDQARKRIDAELPQRDAVRADLLAAMGAAYGGLGLRTERMPMVLEALAIERELDRPEQLVRRLVNAAESLRDNGEAPRAKQVLDEAEALLRGDPQASRGLLGFVQYLQGMVQFSLRENEAAVRYLEQAVATLRAAPDARREDLEAAMLMLSRRWASAGKLAEGLALAQEVVANIRAAQPPRPADLVNALDALGSAYSKSGDGARQVATYSEALALAERTLGAEHFNVAVLHHNLSLAYEQTGDRERALIENERALALGANSVGPAHSFVLNANLARARMLCERGDRVGGLALVAPLRADLPRYPRLVESIANTERACAAD